MRRIGIFGGSFSPPHSGHVAAARAFREALSLDRLYIIPASIPPHKSCEGMPDARHRLALSRLAFSDIPACEVLDIEMRRQGKSYTYLTLEELRREGERLYLLCGTDMFLTLDTWMLPERIFALADIVMMSREENHAFAERVNEKKKEYEGKYRARIHLLDAPVIEISSSRLRQLLADGGDTCEHLSLDVLDYIEKWKLYGVSGKMN